jgi:hypothetical protein
MADVSNIWPEIQKQFPQEWVAVSDGEVIVHHPSKSTFYEELANLPPTVTDLELRYTGTLIPDEDIPLLWQILHIPSINTSREWK